ncbi:MAG TPA: M55 family metallopeptidase [Candidatus Rifleibacterium sp.]|nr:M55 family metallopeptidase [Candidatus Rifleibacterium sp.]HPT46380.1 M55 family metallopeptidase [Candidatus Rifleibacterium sp.]
MKLYIVADMEGIAGVVAETQTGGVSSWFEAARVQYSREIRAVCEAAISAGAEEVYVNDFHGNGLTLQTEILPREVMVIRGGFRPTSGFDLLDSTFSGLVLLGIHARTGTYGAVLPHTYSNKVDFEIFGQPVGEFDILALVAGEMKVPTLLISGDSKAIEQAGTNMPSTHTVITKYSIGTDGALCVHPDRVCEQLREEMKRALKNVSAIEPSQISGPTHLTIRLRDVSLAPRLEWIPGVKRISDVVFAFTGATMKEIANLVYGVATLVEAKF